MPSFFKEKSLSMNGPVTPNELYAIALIVALTFAIFAFRARRKELGHDPMGDFNVKGSIICLIGGIALIDLALFLWAIFYIPNNLGSRHDPLRDILIIGILGIVLIFFGISLIVYWGSWVFKVENGVLTYKRMFEKEVIIPIKDIFRVTIFVIQGFRNEQLYIYNNQNKRIISIRYTQNGYGLFKQRILAVLPPGAIAMNVPPS